MVSLLLRLLLRLARRVGLLLGRIVGGLSVLELLCRLLGQLGSRLYDRLVTGDNGVLYRTTPPPRTESPLSVDGAAIAASGDMSG